MCTTKALLLFFFTFTIFFGLVSEEAAAATLVDLSSDLVLDETDAGEDLLKGFLKMLLFLPDFSTNIYRIINI